MTTDGRSNLLFPFHSAALANFLFQKVHSHESALQIEREQTVSYEAGAVWLRTLANALSWKRTSAPLWGQMGYGSRTVQPVRMESCVSMKSTHAWSKSFTRVAGTPGSEFLRSPPIQKEQTRRRSGACCMRELPTWCPGTTGKERGGSPLSLRVGERWIESRRKLSGSNRSSARAPRGML